MLLLTRWAKKGIISPMKANHWSRIKRFCIRFMHLQLFLSLISLPILISWGLPFSLLSPLGNLFFSPFLTLFLLLCSLIFFLEVCYIPNAGLIWLLDRVTHVWLWFLSYEQKEWLIGFSKPSIIVLLIFVALTFFIMQCRLTCKVQRALPLFVVIFLSVGITLRLTCSTKDTIETIDRIPGHLTLIKHNNQTIVIDPGYMGRNNSAVSWVSYTLIPEIIKRTGKLAINHLIVLQPNNITFQALDTLCGKITVRHVYLPRWTGSLSVAAWRSFKQLQTTLARTNTTIIQINTKPITIDIENLVITITPLEKKIAYQDATYPVLEVSSKIDNKPFTIYAAKHKPGLHLSGPSGSASYAGRGSGFAYRVRQIFMRRQATPGTAQASQFYAGQTANQ